MSTLAFLARIASGAVFVAFGVGKFTAHASELASFKTYGLPAPEVFVYVIGVVEIVGGLMLLFGWLVRPVALVLAGDMVGAIVVSGIKEGEIISLTLAPALLVTMIALILYGQDSHNPGPNVTRLRNRSSEP